MNAERNTHRRASIWAALSCLLVLLFAPSAKADFGLSEFDISFEGPAGETVTQAGAHPFEMTTSLRFLTIAEGVAKVEEHARNLIATFPSGFVGNPTATPRCTTTDFLTSVSPPGGEFAIPDCPDAAAVGVVSVSVSVPSSPTAISFHGAVYNLEPSPGVAAKLGFWIASNPITLELGVSETSPYNVVGGPTNLNQFIEVISSELTIWGVPADLAHDPLRGFCQRSSPTGGSKGNCPANVPETPFLTLPRSCTGPLKTLYRADSWQHPGLFVEGLTETHDGLGNPVGTTGCGKLGFGPEISAQPTALAASSPSGLDFSLDHQNDGFANPEGLSNADLSKTVVTLPKGFTANPSLAEGLEVCTEAQLEAESPFTSPGEGPTYTPPGAGCPDAAKIGTVEIETPVLEGTVLRGAIYIAEPYENPFDSLIAIYMVIKDPKLGIVLKIPLRIDPDPVSGQLVATGEDLPPYPFSHFKLHFREGSRSPLITPPDCGSYDGHDPAHDPVRALLYPSSGGAPSEVSGAFEIVSGPNGGPCPSGAAPFHPGFEAGTLNNRAGSYSPFSMRLTRVDGEQDLTRFSAVLPPGVVGKIAGVPYCPESGIARALSRTGEHGGEAERSDPSCPEASRIGRSLAGAGAGSQLTYVPGELYLAGPYHGAPLSVVSITPAIAGPFDAGTVVVREALTLNPVSGEVEVDGAASDPIPHILQGIPLNVRDLRVYVDRPEFTLNATNCSEEQARATLFGGGTVLAPTLDTPVGLAARYQAADCAALGFKPALAIKLLGGSKRGSHPALRAVVRPRSGDANFAHAAVALPRSAFLDQAHIRTICTRVQFAANGGNGAGCPAASIYGKAKAWSPLLAEPLEGSVFLRSSSNNLPDLVVALHGLVDVELSSRIDSASGGLRSTFPDIPDAPVSKFILEMQGGRKGLIINSRDLCFKSKRNRATGDLTGQNGRLRHITPVVRAPGCAGKRQAKQK